MEQSLGFDTPDTLTFTLTCPEQTLSHLPASGHMASVSMREMLAPSPLLTAASVYEG